MSLGEWAEQWLGAASHLKPKTKVGYQSLLRSVIRPTLGNMPLGSLRRSQVQSWVASFSGRGLSPSRVRQSCRLLSQLLKAAEFDGIVASSPCVGIRLPRIPEHEPHVLTPAEVTALVESMLPRYRTFVSTLAYTGVRFGEAAGLRRRYVRLDDAVLVVASSLSDANGSISLEEPKTHQHRMVTMPGFLTLRLRKCLDELVPSDRDALVFTSPDGLPLRHQNFMRRVWYPACEASGVSATPHDLRASHATWLYDAGWSPVEIAARLGHAKATVTTKHYARRVAGRDIEIASALDVTYEGTTEMPSGHAEGTRRTNCTGSVEGITGQRASDQ